MPVSHDGIAIVFVYIVFSLAVGWSYFKRNFVKISVEFQESKYFLKFRSHHRLGWVPIFFKRPRILDALRAFCWVSKNWDQLKSIR